MRFNSIPESDLPALLDRVAKRIALTDDGCLEWFGAVDGGGYGNVSYGGVRTTGKRRNLKTHRVMYAALVGPIPEGLELDHLCRNRRCCNPDHLEPVTGAENKRRGTSPAALAAVLNECKHGHPYDVANTYVYRGRRQCRKCRAATQTRRNRRLRAQARDAA